MKVINKRIAHLEIDDKRGYDNLCSAQECWLNDVSKSLKEGSKSSQSHLKEIITYFVSTLGVNGSDRKRVIKNAFKVILDNILPESAKVLIFINKHELKANNKELETLRTSSKYKYEELMKERNFGIVEEVYTKTNITKEQRPHLKQ